MNYFRLLAASALLILLSACIGSRSTVPNYYLLTAQAQPSTNTQPKTFSIGVGPVRVAQFLNRPQIVTHDGSGNLHIGDGERWGEPLDQSVQRVLVQNIAVLTNAETRNFPWRQTMTPDYAVRIDVIDLDKIGNNAILDVAWSFEDLKNARVLKTAQERITTNVSGANGSAIANAYSELLSQLAQHVATTLDDSSR